MSAPSFVYTAHAADTLARRGLERAWVERTVLEPDDMEPDPVHLERTRAFRAIPERGDRILRVVRVRDGDVCRIVTVFLDRGRRRRRRAGDVRP